MCAEKSNYRDLTVSVNLNYIWTTVELDSLLPSYAVTPVFKHSAGQTVEVVHQQSVIFVNTNHMVSCTSIFWWDHFQLDCADMAGEIKYNTVLLSEDDEKLQHLHLKACAAKMFKLLDLIKG